MTESKRTKARMKREVRDEIETIPGVGELTPLTRYQADPVRFVREVLGQTLWSRQAQILEAIRDQPQVTVRSGHGVGKTFVAACAALWWLYSFRPSLVLTTAPTARQVEALLWGEIRRLKRRARRALPGRCLATRLVVSEDQEAVGLSTNEPERFAGWHREHLLAIVDEASGVGEAIYETLLGVLTGRHNHLLLIGNPTQPSGTFYESHRREGWEKIKIAAMDSPNFSIADCGTLWVPQSAIPYPCLVTPAWVAARRADWGEASLAYRVRVLAEFPAAAHDALIELAWVEAAEAAGARRAALDASPAKATPADGIDSVAPSVGRFAAPRLAPRACFGIDVARFGECETVVAIRRGARLEALAAWSGSDLMATCGRVIDLIRAHGPERVVIDPVGLGAGLLDRLRERQREGGLPPLKLVEENGAARSSDPEQFVNRRAELYHGLRERYRVGEIAHAQSFPRLVGQLTALRYRFTSRGQWRIESKEELRARGLPSPDQADAVALCFAPEPRLPRPAARGGVRPVSTPLPRL
jgi:phage terminase large subunit